MRRASAAAALIALVALPATAAAQGSGNSTVDQYTEGLPGAGGEHPSNPAGGASAGGGSRGGSALSPAAQHALQAQGAIGSRTEALAEATAPTGVGNGAAGEPRGGSSDGGKQASAPETGGGSGISNAFRHAVGDEGSGMGIGFPVILGLSLLAALAYPLLRRRHAREQQS